MRKLEGGTPTVTMATITFPDREEISRIVLAETPTVRLPVIRREPLTRPARHGISSRALNVLIAVLCVTVILLCIAIAVLLWFYS